MSTSERIRKYNKRLEALKSERSDFMSLWGELSEYHLFYRGRFLSDQQNKVKRATKQINNKSRMAVRTLASGMMSGITSPARPWFQLGTSDTSLSEHSAVKMWLHQVQAIMYQVFSQSNVYNSLHSLYSEVGVFGTGAMGVYFDRENVIHCKTYTAGGYLIATNSRNEVDTFYREYQLSVNQVVDEFGYDNCSTDVQQRYNNGNGESWVKIVHVIEPNVNRDHMSVLARDKKVRSAYYERSESTNDKFLRESGFDDFPIMAPRWNIADEDIYGTDCPGMDALGDTKSLQLGEKRKYQAVDTVVQPPMQAPASMKGLFGKSGVRAGQIIWTPTGNDKISSIYNYNPDLNAIMAINTEAEQRISRAFYEDLFLMIANEDRRQITAREIAEKQEEKLLMLGPVLERLHSELLDPLINRTFNILQQAGALPPPPEELQNVELNVEYISVLAQAQRMIGVGGLERTIQFAGNLATIWPDARHKIDPMQTIDEYAHAMGINPRVVRPDEQAEASVQAERQAQAQAAAMEQGAAMANTAKTVSETDLSDDNMLSTVLANQGLI